MKISTAYSVKYMDHLDLRARVLQARSSRTIQVVKEKPLAFVSGLLHKFYSTDDTIEKLDILCSLWVFAARKHKIKYQENHDENEEHIPSFEILESFGHALRCYGIVREWRFFDVSRNIENAISRLGYDPYTAIGEKIHELQSFCYGSYIYKDYESAYTLREAVGKTSFVGCDMFERSTREDTDFFYIKWEHDNEKAIKKIYSPNYEKARLTSFVKTNLFNIEPFDKIKHYKIKSLWGRSKTMRKEDSLAEYWVDQGSGRVFPYSAIYRKTKKAKNDACDVL